MNAPGLVESVLHPTDFSLASERAFAHALAIALLRNTRLTILNVAGDGDRSGDLSRFPVVKSTLERWGLAEAGNAWQTVFGRPGFSVANVALTGRSSSRKIAEFIEQTGVDLLVLATGSNEPAGWLRGSTAVKIARRTRTMALFVPAWAERDIVTVKGQFRLKNVLVPFDRVPDPARAVEFARRAAERLGAGDVTITLLHVGAGPALPRVAAEDGPGWVFRHEYATGDPVGKIVEVAMNKEAELIVMPTAGRQGLLDAVLGSTTEQVLRRSPCPLLAVPAAAGSGQRRRA
ncbi:MAG TPA: universal stress protein [Woeseiaceae bacterium]|nr:universal stress protein [Woeseiaceae bacterium]